MKLNEVMAIVAVICFIGGIGFCFFKAIQSANAQQAAQEKQAAERLDKAPMIVKLDGVTYQLYSKSETKIIDGFTYIKIGE